MNLKFTGIAALFLVSAVAMAACGSGDSSGDSASESSSDSAQDEEQAPVVRIGETFTIDQFEAAGFKLVKELDASLLPLAENVYFGFSERRDVEVRKYATHADAISAGADAALSAIGRSPASNSGGVSFTSGGNRTSFHAYLVAGNMVLLCQMDITVCENLINAIP